MPRRRRYSFRIRSGGEVMKRLVLDGVDLAYEDRGDGDALVFLHGMGMQIEVWQPIMDLLVADHRVIAYDLRSFGRSTTGR